MNENEEPIYDFSALKSFLKKKGFTIGTRHAYEAIKPEDVKPEDVTNGTMEFRAAIWKTQIPYMQMRNDR